MNALLEFLYGLHRFLSQLGLHEVHIKMSPSHLSLGNSMRALRREREMLANQMQKKLSEEERMKLFTQWGIQLTSKNRRLHLVNRLWTNTEDMNHISESAGIVARLLEFVKPEQAFKEMFGLNFTPRRMSKRSHSWKLSIKPFS